MTSVLIISLDSITPVLISDQSVLISVLINNQSIDQWSECIDHTCSEEADEEDAEAEKRWSHVPLFTSQTLTQSDWELL